MLVALAIIQAAVAVGGLLPVALMVFLLEVILHGDRNHFLLELEGAQGYSISHHRRLVRFQCLQYH